MNNIFLKKDKKKIEHTKTIDSIENAQKTLDVPQIISQYRDIDKKISSFPIFSKYMIGSMKQINQAYNSIVNQPIKSKKRISLKDLKTFESIANNLGIDTIGYTKVDRSFIFENKSILFSNAIVFIMKMDPLIIQSAPSKEAEKEIYKTYFKLNKAVNELKDFLNSIGYKAQAGPALGGDVNYPRLAEKAGLGVIGKNGILISENFGPSIRIATIYCDIKNLPYTDSDKYLWIKEFCNICNNCVDKCPANAIYKDTIIYEDGNEEHIDHKKCAVSFSNNNGCSICIKECLFFKNDYDKLYTAYKIRKDKSYE